ncbi:putative reverse transcriptase domain-containing protein [Tanacetum coccineum]|uniref:Reverse transcriptase domain-containing protein n=1 Tax=Tanacetum coccineum TaxID=301880 RepID=A0ABQ4WVR6_9ASTR
MSQKNGIHVDPSKIEAVKNWKAPTTPSKIRSFLGLAEDFVVYCDASNQGLGCVLMQRGKEITYASRQLKIHEKNYTTHDLELGAIVFALNTWRHYMYGTKSVIYTDHKSLQRIFDQKELNMRQSRWIELFSDYECEIRYHPGKANVVANALRMILAAQGEAFKQENVLAERLHGLDQQMERREDGSLYFLDRIWVPLVEVARHEVPVSIILDRDGRFTSRFWQTLQKALGTRLDMSTAYHPQTDGQSERTIQTLEDMLRVCVIDFGGNWDVHLPLVEFSYNNSCHSSIRCAPFEALYGRKCRSPVLWAEIRESSLIRPELVQETTDKVVLIKEKLKVVRDHQKSYADNRRKPLEFEVGDKVLLKVSPWKGVMHFGKKGKLALGYVGPFEIHERIGPVAYMLRLPKELSKVHDTFHVSNLKKCLANANLHVPLDEIKINKTLHFVKKPVEIMDREVKTLNVVRFRLLKCVGIQSVVLMVKSRDEISLRRGYCDNCVLSRLCARFYQVAEHQIIVYCYWRDSTAATESFAVESLIVSLEVQLSINTWRLCYAPMGWIRSYWGFLEGLVPRVVSISPGSEIDYYIDSHILNLYGGTLLKIDELSTRGQYGVMIIADEADLNVWVGRIGEMVRKGAEGNGQEDDRARADGY